MGSPQKANAGERQSLQFGIVELQFKAKFGRDMSEPLNDVDFEDVKLMYKESFGMRPSGTIANDKNWVLQKLMDAYARCLISPVAHSALKKDLGCQHSPLVTVKCRFQDNFGREMSEPLNDEDFEDVKLMYKALKGIKPPGFVANDKDWVLQKLMAAYSNHATKVADKKHKKEDSSTSSALAKPLLPTENAKTPSETSGQHQIAQLDIVKKRFAKCFGRELSNPLSFTDFEELKMMYKDLTGFKPVGMAANDQNWILQKLITAYSNEETKALNDHQLEVELRQRLRKEPDDPWGPGDMAVLKNLFKEFFHMRPSGPKVNDLDWVKKKVTEHIQKMHLEMSKDDTATAKEEADAELDGELRMKIGKANDDPWTDGDVEALRDLYKELFGLNPSLARISKVSHLEWLRQKNMEQLRLRHIGHTSRLQFDKKVVELRSRLAQRFGRHADKAIDEEDVPQLQQLFEEIRGKPPSGPKRNQALWLMQQIIGFEDHVQKGRNEGQWLEKWKQLHKEIYGNKPSGLLSNDVSWIRNRILDIGKLLECKKCGEPFVDKHAYVGHTRTCPVQAQPACHKSKRKLEEDATEASCSDGKRRCPEDSSLPNGWEQQWSSEHNRPFYWNTQTLQSSWSRPMPSVGVSEPPNTLPPGWERQWSGHHKREFYWKEATQESSWVRPAS